MSAESRIQDVPFEGSSRSQRVLSREVVACEDPTCCCEPEPRWLYLESHDQNEMSEWEVIQRYPCDEF